MRSLIFTKPTLKSLEFNVVWSLMKSSSRFHWLTDAEMNIILYTASETIEISTFFPYSQISTLTPQCLCGSNGTEACGFTELKLKFTSSPNNQMSKVLHPPAFCLPPMLQRVITCESFYNQVDTTCSCNSVLRHFNIYLLKSFLIF